jgi:hypothetical protein
MADILPKTTPDAQAGTGPQIHTRPEIKNRPPHPRTDPSIRSTKILDKIFEKYKYLSNLK